MSKRKPAFGGELVLITTLHALLLGMMLGASFFGGCSTRPPTDQPIELTIPDFAGDSAQKPEPRRDEAKQEEKQPEVKADEKPPERPPDKDDIPEPSRQKAKPDSKPKAKPQAEVKKEESKKKGEIKLSKTLVHRGTSKTKLTPDEIQRLLDKGGRIGTPKLTDTQLRDILNTSLKFSKGNEMTQEMLYLELVRQTLYKSWDQPTSIGIAGLVTRVELSMNTDGSITDCRITGSSGNRVMDDSVMGAVKSVHRIPGIPPSFLQSHRRIPVAFELTGNG